MTEGRKDGKTDRLKTVYPLNYVCGRYNKQFFEGGLGDVAGLH